MMSFKNMEMNEDLFTNPLLKFHLKSLLWYGYVIKANEKNKRCNVAKGIFLTASFLGACFLLLIRVGQGFDELVMGATSCATAALYLATSITLLNAFYHRRRVIRLCIFINEDLNQMLPNIDNKEMQIVAESIRYVQRMTASLWVPAIVAAIIIFLQCFYRKFFKSEAVFINFYALHIRWGYARVAASTTQPIILYQLFPFGEIYDNFILKYFGPCLALFLGITIIPLWHSFMNCLMHYIKMKYDIICKRLEEMDISRCSDFNEDKKLVNESQLTYWQLKICEYCVKEQVNMRWFLKELQTLLSVPVFMDFIIFSVLICFLFIALIMGNPSTMDYLFTIIYLFVMALILWFYHWNATQIVQCNYNLCLACYCCPWYNYDLIVQKTLRFIMMNTLAPLRFKALLIELNLRIFIDVVRGSYSYFSVLRSLN